VSIELQLLRLVRQHQKPAPSSQKHDAARALLRDSHTSATACTYAVEVLYGGQVRAWEPESLWLSLSRDDVDIPLVNRDKILAAHTLLMLPAFWWEVNIFENTVMAFNDMDIAPDTLQEATPGQISWGVFEAELLFTQSEIKETPTFDREPTAYTATILHRAGYVLAPDLLQFAQPLLDKMVNGSGHVAKKDITAAWHVLKEKPVSERVFEDDSLGYQLAQLTTVDQYLQERTDRYETDLKKLRG
jgi:hypothetical protein